MSEMELLIAQMAELTGAIKGMPEFDYDRYSGDIEKLYTRLTDAQAEDTKKRWGAFTDIGKDEKKRVQTGPFKGLDALDLFIIGQTNKMSKRGNSDALQKAMDSTSTGAGDEFVPTMIAGDIWEEIYLSSKIAAALGPAIAMPTDPFKVPLWSTYTWLKGTENTATTASNPTTDDSTLTGTELVAEVNWSYTLSELSIVPMLPALRAEMVRSGAYYVDYFFLNADSTDASTGNINLDDANPADNLPYLSAGQDGLRHQWLVDNTAMTVDAGGNALTDSDILSALALMGKKAINPADTFMVVDASTYFKGLLNLDGVQTLDKFGPKAVLMTGELAKYRGIPVIVSEAAPLTMADGKVSTTSNNNTLGQLTIVNHLGWKHGAPRGLMIEVDKDIQKRQMIMVGSMIIAIAAYEARASETHTAGVMNILVA